MTNKIVYPILQIRGMGRISQLIQEKKHDRVFTHEITPEGLEGHCKNILREKTLLGHEKNIAKQLIIDLMYFKRGKTRLPVSPAIPCRLLEESVEQEKSQPAEADLSPDNAGLPQQRIAAFEQSGDSWESIYKSILLEAEAGALKPELKASQQREGELKIQLARAVDKKETMRQHALRLLYVKIGLLIKVKQLEKKLQEKDTALSRKQEAQQLKAAALAEIRAYERQKLFQSLYPGQALPDSDKTQMTELFLEVADRTAALVDIWNNLFPETEEPMGRTTLQMYEDIISKISEMKNLLMQLEGIKGELDAARRDCARLDLRAELYNSIRLLFEKIKEKEAHFKDTNKSPEEVFTWLWDEYQKNKEKIAKLEAELARVNAEKTRIDEMLSREMYELGKLRDEYRSLLQAKEKDEEELKTSRQKIKSLSEKLEGDSARLERALIEKQPIIDELYVVVDDLRQQLAAAEAKEQADVSGLQAQLAAAQEELERTKNQQKIDLAALNNLNNIYNKIKILVEQMGIVFNAGEEIKALEDFYAKLESLKEELEEAKLGSRTIMQQHEEVLKTLKRYFENSKDSKLIHLDPLEAVGEYIKHLESQLRDIDEDFKRYVELYEGKKRQVKELEQARAASDEAVGKAEIRQAEQIEIERRKYNDRIAEIREEHRRELEALRQEQAEAIEIVAEPEGEMEGVKRERDDYLLILAQLLETIKTELGNEGENLQNAKKAVESLIGKWRAEEMAGKVLKESNRQLGREIAIIKEEVTKLRDQLRRKKKK